MTRGQYESLLLYCLGLSPVYSLPVFTGALSGESQAIDLARELVERRDQTGPEIIDFIETILVYKLPTLSRQEIIAMLTLDNIELKQTRFYQEIAQEEGQQRSQRMVSRMMRHKFGTNPAVQQAEQQLPMLDVEQLEELAEALLDLTETQELTRWLAGKLA